MQPPGSAAAGRGVDKKHLVCSLLGRSLSWSEGRRTVREVKGVTQGSIARDGVQHERPTLRRNPGGVAVEVVEPTGQKEPPLGYAVQEPAGVVGGCFCFHTRFSTAMPR
jgi:hypothetical protein